MKICNLKIDVSCEASVNFQIFSAHRTKCHACHGICTLSPLDAALPMRFTKATQHDTSKVLRLPRKMTMDTSKVLRLPRNLPRIFAKRRKSIAPATHNDFRHVTERCWMSRSATPATRNEATRRLKPPKMIPPAELPIGTAIRSSHERLRTAANGCGRFCDRERNVERTHPQPPDPQSETGTLATHSGKNIFLKVQTVTKIYSKLPHFLPMTQIDNCIENWPHRPKFAMDNFLTDRWASQQETSNYFEGFPASHVWFPNIIIISRYCCLYPHDCSGIVVQSKPPFIDDVPLTTSISTGFSHWNLNWSRIFPARTPHRVQGFSVAWWSPRPRGGGEVHSTAKLVLLCASGKGGVCGLRSGRAWRVHGTSWQQWHPYIFYSHLTSKKIEQPCDLFWWDLTIFDQLLSFWGLLSWFVMEI